MASIEVKHFRWGDFQRLYSFHLLLLKKNLNLPIKFSFVPMNYISQANNTPQNKQISVLCHAIVAHCFNFTVNHKWLNLYFILNQL